MNDQKRNVLLLSAGRRVELMQAFRGELDRRGLQVQLLATDLRPELSAACQQADASFPVPRVTDPGYLDRLLDLCVQQQVGLVIPTIDTELLGLAQSRERFADRGIHVVVSSEALVEQCRDKR